MIKIISLYFLIPIFIFGFFLISRAQNPLKYKYLFRNTILSASNTHELAAVLRGRIYYPRYFFIPSLKQYIVYSDVDETGPFRVYERNTQSEGKTYALLNEAGKNILTFRTPLRFSYRSGCFYGPATYIPLLETGKTDTLPYHHIHNAKLDLSRKEFEKLFIELYSTAEYIEFINLRASRDDDHQAGIIFKREDRVEILLSGLQDSRMTCYFQEDRTINSFDDYYVADFRDTDNYPQSQPAIEMIALETNNTNPFMYWRTGFNKEVRMKKYQREYSSGWQGIAKVHGIPVYLPGNGSGIAYVRLKAKGEVFRIKLLDIEKSDFIPVYNLGLRTFQLPQHLRTKQSLVFVESAQNGGSNRMGGGVFVVRPTTNTNPSADIPSDMSEEYFNTLPLTLQEALLHPDSTFSLKIEDKNITAWIPEIERLKNLRHLEISTSMTEIPDAISTFTKLESLSMTYGKINKISPQIVQLKNLTTLDLFSNKLTAFPTVLLELSNLKRLKIGANDIALLPNDINRLQQLEYLSITLTKITSLPESMIGMKNLYIDDSQDLKNKVPDAFKHLFDYTKLKTPY